MNEAELDAMAQGRSTRSPHSVGRALCGRCRPRPALPMVGVVDPDYAGERGHLRRAATKRFPTPRPRCYSPSSAME